LVWSLSYLLFLLWIYGTQNKIKYHIIQFLTKTSLHIPISVGCDNNIKSNITNIIFLGIMIDNTLLWKTHTEMIITKLSVATFVVRAIKPIVTLDTLKMVYHSYFHSIIIYRIIFWGNSSYSNSIFKLQQRIIRIIMGVGIRDSCTDFLKYEIFYHWSHNLYSLSHSSWLIMKINFGWILRYIISILGTLLVSINHCHIWLYIRQVPFIWVLRYITVFHLKYEICLIILRNLNHLWKVNLMRIGPCIILIFE